MSNSTTRIIAATVAGLALLGLAGCARPTAGVATAAPAKSTVSAPPSVTLVTPPPSTVYAQPPATVTVPAKPLTPCQRLHADGYSFDAAFAAWVQAGYPPNWDADHDGYPCEQSYGEQN
jgi:hypothetical protein